MDNDSASIAIDDREIWKQRSARLNALESVNKPHRQTGFKFRMNQLLHAAAEEGDVDKFIEALEKCSAEEGVSLSHIVDMRGPSGNSLLHVAAGITEADILRALLEVIHDKQLATEVNYRGDTALHVAARAGSISTAELLLGYGSILDMANDAGNTALHEAVKNSHYELISLLMSRGSRSVYQKNKESKCPLYLAVEMGDSNSLKLLMEAADGHEVLRSRMEGMSPVHGAVIHERIEMMKEMSNWKKEIFYLRDAGGGTPLHLAASMNYVDGVKFLVNEFTSSAFEVDEEGHLPIHIACKKGHLKIIKELLQLWPKPDELLTRQEGQNILHVAAKHGDVKVIEYILRNPKLEKLINAKDKEGNTALHLAASQLESLALMSLVVDCVVDLKLVNNGNLTALDIAEEQLKKIDGPVKAYRPWAVHVLKAVKAPGSKEKAICGPKDLDPGRAEEPIYLKKLRDVAGHRMVVATLVATMTFAAGFSVPGGYNGIEPDAGIATLLNKPMYDVFVICNTVAMYSSIMTAVILLMGQISSSDYAHEAINKTRLPLLIALATMSMAFMAGVYVTASKRTWVAVVTLIVGITSLFLIIRIHFYFFSWFFFNFKLCIAPHVRRLSSKLRRSRGTITKCR